MIERIEVSTTGEMPDGRRVVGNVINVILKKNYNGATLSGRQRNSVAGGGAQSQINASAGRTLGRLSARVNFTRREQNSLRASERDFSSDQDRTAEGGSDYRAAYGDAPVVQAASGSLHGLTDPTGAADFDCVRVRLAVVGYRSPSRISSPRRQARRVPPEYFASTRPTSCTSSHRP